MARCEILLADMESEEEGDSCDPTTSLNPSFGRKAIVLCGPAESFGYHYRR
jgi:hypothetical protein